MWTEKCDALPCQGPKSSQSLQHSATHQFRLPSFSWHVHYTSDRYLSQTNLRVTCLYIIYMSQDAKVRKCSRLLLSVLECATCYQLGCIWREIYTCFMHLLKANSVWLRLQCIVSAMCIIFLLTYLSTYSDLPQWCIINKIRHQWEHILPVSQRIKPIFLGNSKQRQNKCIISGMNHVRLISINPS